MLGYEKHSKREYQGGDQRYTDGYRSEDKEKIKWNISMLSAFQVQGTYVDDATTIPIEIQGAYLRYSIAKRKGIHVGYFISPGDWINTIHLLETPSLMRIDEQIFQFDKQREQHEIRLSLYFAERFRDQVEGGTLGSPLSMPVENQSGKSRLLTLDPGSRTTGIAIVSDCPGEVVFAAELAHRGHEIKKAMDSRPAVRHSRRARHTRYRKPRFDNRKPRDGWLPPSLESRIANVLTWVKRLMRLCPITAISMELVKFDMQAMDNPEISAAEYQQGALFGYEVREYLLEKWGRACVYCGKQNIPLQVEHIVARANGGTNRVSNLTLSCEKCNRLKGTRDIREFLAKKPEALRCVLAQAKAPLKDASAVNSTRWALYERLKATGLPIEYGNGGLTKFNRTMRELPKAHWCDACCVGKSTPEHLQMSSVVPLLITASGHGCRQMRLVDRRGFPRGKPKQAKRVKGFQTGDIVKAVVTEGVNTGVHISRVAVRATGSFNITTKTGQTVQGINARYCTALHKNDGYSYRHGKELSQAPDKEHLLPPRV